MKKRLFALVLAILICFPVLASCDSFGGQELKTNEQTESPIVETASKTEKVTNPESETLINDDTELSTQSESKQDTATASETQASETEAKDSEAETAPDASETESKQEEVKDEDDDEGDTSAQGGAPSTTPPAEITTEQDTPERETHSPSDSGTGRGLEFVLRGDSYVLTGIGTCTDQNITVPSEYNGSPVSAIGNRAFVNNTQIVSITLPHSIKTIGSEAFYGCTKLTAVTIPAGVTSIGNGAFYNCRRLNSIIYEGTVSAARELFTHNNVNLKHISCADGVMTIEQVVKQAEYNTYTSTMPNNWNELTYTENNDTQFMSYLGSSFFSYDYKFEGDQKYNSDGSINKAGIIAGAYTTNYDAAIKLEDVTALVDAKWGYTDYQKDIGGYAWKITLRDDLKWDDGTPITAADFVWSMKQAIDPNFMNHRASTYYDSMMIKNAREYIFQNQGGRYEPLGNLGYASVADALAAGEELYINIWNIWGTRGYVDSEGNECPEYVLFTDTTVWDTAEAWAADTAVDAISGADLYTYYRAYLEPGTGYDACIFVEAAEGGVAWEDVGIYSIDEENAIVICLDNQYSFLTEDGALSVWAPYYLSSLPLLKRDLYESCKIEPTEEGGLWTTCYCTSLDTTASWGPYKLVEFDYDHYRLEKNEYWYGWNMSLYDNQYNITAINCTYAFYWSDIMTGYLSGAFDVGSINSENAEEYANSKYAYYSSNDTGTYGIQLYSNLEVLKSSGNNNGILAIPEFRQAFSLALNRYDVVERIWPGTAIPCFGIVNSAYYYDIENAPLLSDGGQYRNNKLAKEGLLRAYGFVQTGDGAWSTGDVTGLSLDDAYAMITGYNPTLAKEKMREAIEILLADPEKYGYDADKSITLVYGSSSDASNQRAKADYVQDLLNYLTMGTALEGKIVIEFSVVGAQWSQAFRTGETQIGFGYGFSGNAFNPFDIIGAFVNPDDPLNYHSYWDTSAIDLTITMPEGDYEGAGETITMSVLNWYFCLNGMAYYEGQPMTYNWGAGYAPTEARLTILSALEEFVIREGRSIMMIANSGATLIGAKFSFFSDTDHTFMGFGGIRYMEVNYTDEEWEAFLIENEYDLSDIYKEQK